MSGYGNNGGRLLGLRESNQALAELKTKLEFALSRLNDQDTQRTGIEEIREFLQGLYPDWFPMVISCIGEAGTNLKPLGRCESVKLLGLLAELHGDAVVPLLARILQVVVTRLQDADLHLREACAETVFRLTRALVDDVEGAGVFGTLLKPLFGALGEHSKWVQIGAAACICSVIQGSPPSVVRDNLGRLCSRLVQHLSLPLAMAKPQLLGACIYTMEAVSGADFDEVLPSLFPCLESCINASSDWQTRKQAIEVLQTIGDNPDLGQSLDLPPSSNQPGPTPLQRHIALLLEVVRTDKVRAVREAVKDVMLRWTITKTPGPPQVVRSSSPTNSGNWTAEAREALQQHKGSTGPARSSSPIAARLTGSQPLGEQPLGTASLNLGGNAGHRQNRSQRASMREREEEVMVLIPPERAKASTEPTILASSVEKVDAAGEKARAIKAALSGAALNSTKKPRPKRERQSIFSGPANTSFFNQAAAPGGGEDGDDMDPGGDDGLDAEKETAELQRQDTAELQRQEEEEFAREMRASQLRAKRNSPRVDSTPARQTASTADSWPDSSVPHTPASGREGEDRLPVPREQANALGPATEESTPSFASASTGGVRRMLSGSRQRGEQPAPKAGVNLSTGEAAGSPGFETSPREPVSLATAGARRAGAEAMARVAQPPLDPPAQNSVGLSNKLIEDLAERLQVLEDEKREGEERLRLAVHSLERACDGQNESIVSQATQLELMERRLQLQEQAAQHQEQRVQQQEQQLRQQEKRMHDQELQIQQLEQQCEEYNSVLREHEQQMEQQDQLIAKQRSLVDDLLVSSSSSASRGPSVRVEDQMSTNPPQRSVDTHNSTAPRSTFDGPPRPPASTIPLQAESLSRPALEAWANSPPTSGQLAGAAAPVPIATGEADRVKAPEQRAVASEPNAMSAHRPVTAASLREGLMQAPMDASGTAAAAGQKAVQGKKAAGPLWEKVLELCEEQRYLEAYKQVIAEPEETCLLRLMQHTGPIVEQLDAESNSRLIRRLIHILSSPKEPAASCIEQVFAWLWQALEVGIHFTSSQVEDLASALQKASAPHSFRERAEAAQLLSRVSALRRS